MLSGCVINKSTCFGHVHPKDMSVVGEKKTVHIYFRFFKKEKDFVKYQIQMLLVSMSYILTLTEFNQLNDPRTQHAAEI